MLPMMLDESNPPANMNQELIHAVLPYAQHRDVDSDTDLVTMGEPSECFYYVEKGTVEVSYTANRTPIVVAYIGDGSFFGEIGFFDKLTRTRNIKVFADTHLKKFDHQAMNRMATVDPTLYARFLEHLLRTTCERFRQVLSDRGPLTAYAAALATGKDQFKGLQQVPADLLGSPDWQTINRALEDIKAQLYRLTYELQADPSPNISVEQREKGRSVVNKLFEMARQAEQILKNKESAELIWGYVFKEMFPYLMRSRFFERAYYKPKGYAGDFRIIEQIYRNQAEGDGKIGRLLDEMLLEQVSAKAVRARRPLLHHTLDQLCRDRLDQEDPIRIMNLACGPCRELFDLIATCDYSEKIDALCIDIDAEALEYADQQVNTFDHPAQVRFMRENVIKWALGRAKQDFGAQDIIYSSGLCDYLDRRLLLALINRCYRQLKPGGVLIIGNFSPANIDRPVMDHLLYWRLIHRDQAALTSVFKDSPFGKNVQVISEDQGVNLFAVASRPAP